MLTQIQLGQRLLAEFCISLPDPHLNVFQLPVAYEPIVILQLIVDCSMVNSLWVFSQLPSHTHRSHFPFFYLAGLKIANKPGLWFISNLLHTYMVGVAVFRVLKFIIHLNTKHKGCESLGISQFDLIQILWGSGLI